MRARSITTGLAIMLATTTLAIPPAASVPVTAESVPSLPGEITLPPLYGTELPNVRAEIGDTGTVFWKDRLDSVDDVINYVPAPGNPDVPAPPVTDTWNVAGKYAFWGPTNDGTPFASQRYDLSTGAQTTLRSAYFVNESAKFIAGTGAGWIDFQMDPDMRYTYTDVATRTTIDLGMPARPAGVVEWWFQDSWAARAVDDAGGIFEIYGDMAPGSSLSSRASFYYVDFATATWTLLEEDSPSAPSALSQDWIAWTHLGAVKSVPRSTPTATPVTRTYGDEWPTSLALDGDTLVALTREGYRTGDSILRAGDASGGLALVPLDQRLRTPVVLAPGGGFAMKGGTTPETYGFYKITLDRAVLSNAFVLFGASAPLGLEASAGRLIALRGGSRSALERLVTQPTDTSVKVHASTTLVTTVPGSNIPQASGGQSAYLKTVDGDTFAVILDGTSIVQMVRVPDGSYEVRISGQRILVSWALPEGDGGGYRVIDLASGATTDVAGRRGATLWGQWLAYSLPDASIRLRDVYTGTARTIRPAGFPAGASPTDSFLEMQAFGDWIIPSWGTGIYTTTSEAINVATGQRIDLPSDTVPVLNDELIAWIAHADGAVNVMNLSTGQRALVGQGHPFWPNRTYVTLTDEFIAWVASDDTTRVLPLAAIPLGALTAASVGRTATTKPFDVEVTPRYLGRSGSSVFSPNGDGSTDRFRPRMDVSRPLTSWRLEIRDASGRTIRTLTGTAPKGNVRPDWSGLTSSGAKARPGSYTWRLMGAGADGPLRRSNGATTPITGSITLKR